MKDFGVCKSIRQYGFELDADGDPLKEDCIKNNFIMYYSTSEGLELFDALYENRNGLKDKYLRFFDELGKKFGNNSNIVGYDPINEPFCSHFMKDLSLLLEKNFDKKKLLPLYDQILDVL